MRIAAFALFAFLLLGVPQALAGSACLRAEETLSNISQARNAVFRSVKQDAGIPNTLQPLKIRKVPMTDSSGRQLFDELHEPIVTREYDFIRPSDGKAITIQEHTAGHTFGDGGSEPPHFNVRPTENTRNGTVQGTQSHYYVDVKQ